MKAEHVKKTGLLLLIFLVLTGVYYAIWRNALADDVERVKITIAHHNEMYRAKNRWVTLKTDDIYPVGFPFSSRVRVDRPTLTFVWGKETYGVSLPWAELSLRDAESGTYVVTYAPTLEAVYAESGQAPEEYTVTPRQTLAVLVRAHGDSRECSFLPSGQRCKPVSPTDPLITYAVQLPDNLTIDMTLNGRTREAGFQLVSINIPLFRRFPEEADRPVQMLVNILREALVYQ